MGKVKVWALFMVSYYLQKVLQICSHKLEYTFWMSKRFFDIKLIKIEFISYYHPLAKLVIVCNFNLLQPTRFLILSTFFKIANNEINNIFEQYLDISLVLDLDKFRKNH